MRRNYLSRKGIESWTTSEFQIRQLLPANGAKAVFIIESADGSADLASIDCSFLGLASETIVHWKKRSNESEKQEQIQTIDNVIVCMEVRGGYERILNEAPNFAGIQMPGQKIEECLGQASSDFLVKLRPKEDSKNQGKDVRNFCERQTSRRNTKATL